MMAQLRGRPELIATFDLLGDFVEDLQAESLPPNMTPQSLAVLRHLLHIDPLPQPRSVSEWVDQANTWRAGCDHLQAKIPLPFPFSLDVHWQPELAAVSPQLSADTQADMARLYAYNEPSKWPSMGVADR